MKSAIATSLLASSVVAFPHLASKLGAPQPIEARQIDPSAPQGRGALPVTPPPFDAAAQRIDVSGEHKFVPPGPGDARGPCPGLNALANHGYLPHNGRATISQFTDATEAVFGMGRDLGGFLSLYGALVDGNGLGWSISGGPREGIGGSHNNYETDSSPLRADLAQYGSNQRLIMSQFFDLYNRQPDASTANYNLEVLRDFRRDRLQESKEKNTLFSYLPFSGIEVSQAAFTFIYRFMGNKSEEFPAGVLNKEVLKSFMSIQGPEDDLRWVPGHERIPENWYKRNPDDQYGVVPFELDVLYFAAAVPEILQIGCNKGTVNSFELLDPQLITNGLYTTSQILESPVCFASQFALAQLPLLSGLDLSSPLLRPVAGLLNSVTSALNLDCAKIGALNQSALAVCPGFSLYGGPTGPVAPGAIQS